MSSPWTSVASGAPFSLKSGIEILQRRRIEHGARQHVRAGLARLLEHGDGERLAALFLLELREPQRRRHPGGPAADDQDIDFEGLALGHATCSVRRSSPGTTSNRSPTMP